MALTPGKAKKMLSDGTVHGQSLSDKQKRYFGAIAGGATPMKAIDGADVEKAQYGDETEEKSVWGFVKELAKIPGANVSNLLGVMGIPANLIAEATESLTGRGDGEFNFMDAMPSFATPGSDDEIFTFTNQNNTPVKNVAGLEDADGNPLVENPVGAFITNLATDPSTYVGAGIVKNVAKKLSRNAYKINPWAFKPNPKAYYHRSPNLNNITNRETGVLQGFGESEAGKLYDEFAASNPGGGFNLLKGPNTRLYFSKGVPLDYGRYNPKSSGMSGQGYRGPYIAEVEGVPMGSSVKGRAPKSTPPSNVEGYAVSRRPIALDEANFYKEDWLRGYKQIDPLKKQNGGWLDKFEHGGSLPGASGMMYSRNSGSSAMSPPNLTKAQDGDKVMYGTPEYEAAYEEGRFADVPNPLDEVVIDSGVDYEKYPLYDKLSTQQKEYFNDPGAIGRGVRRAAQTDRGLAEDTRDMVTGMLLQQPLAALQAPQSLMVEGIETLRGRDANLLNALTFGTQRLPSQTMGFEDKPGWDVGGSLNTTMDVLADPSNLLGAGLVDDVLKLGLRQGLKNTAVKNIDNLANFKNSVTGPLTKVTNPLSNFRTTMGKLTERFKTQGNAKANPFWKGFNENPVPSAAKFDKDWVSAPGFNQRYDKFVYRHQDPELLKRYRSTQDLINQGLNNLKLKQPDLFTNSSTTVNMFNDSNVAGKILQEELSMPLRQISKMFPRLKTDADMLTGLYHQKSNIGNTLVSARNASMNLDQISATGKFTDVFNVNSLSPDDLKYFEENSKVLGFFRNSENRAIINEDAVRAYYGQNPSKMSAYMKSVLNHENSHAIDAGGRAVKPIYKNTTRAAIPEIVDDSKNVLTGVTQKNIEEVWPGFKNLSKERKERLAYLSEPTEVVARIKELRSQFIPKKFVGTDKQYEMSDDLIKKIISEGKKGNTSVDATFFRMIKDKEAFKNLFKVLPAVAAPIAIGVGQQRNGGSTPKAQYGINGKFSLPIRKGVRSNYDDQGNVVGESSHIMATETDGKGNWFSFPTLFQDEDDTWIDMSEQAKQNWEPVYEEAKKRGEVIDFGTDEKGALEFGEGSWKPKMKHGGWLSKYENGGVIEDNRGQWAHPGKITKINSNKITMKGVNYPVLGISDTGDKKMMQPGKDYKFDGNSVTEYPMAKDGKSLVELDQLTNFTNYNTSQPGGWLNKYN